MGLPLPQGFPSAVVQRRYGRGDGLREFGDGARPASLRPSGSARKRALPFLKPGTTVCVAGFKGTGKQ